MTIIQPHRKKFQVNTSSVVLFLLVIAAAVISIRSYNAVVGTRYALAGQQKALKQMEITNSELRNKLYALLDTATGVKDKLGLQKEGRPEYVTVPVVASR